jgi:DNA-binding MarR family transcriptional regulator
MYSGTPVRLRRVRTSVKLPGWAADPANGSPAVVARGGRDDMNSGAPSDDPAGVGSVHAAPVHADADQAATGQGDAAPLKLEEFLPYRLNVVASLVSQALSRIYADRYGIGVPEWRVLVTLGQYGMMTGKAIGAHSHMHKTKVSRAVALLEQRKLVTRRANRADLREAFLTLTPPGRAMYDDLAPIALEFARRLADAIDPDDRAAFERSIDRLTERSVKLAAEFTKGKRG